MVVMANYGIEHTLLFYCEFIVDLIVQFGFTKDVIFFQGVHHLPFTHWKNITSFVKPN